jgi:antitoxin PrlF
MKASKLTSKNQTTIPKSVRDFLEVRSGDIVVFEIEDDQVVLKKAQVQDLDYLKSIEQNLSEWHSEHDEEAYKNL